MKAHLRAFGLLSLAFATSSPSCGQAFAQQASPSAEQENPSAGDIVVTAQKRSESISKVGLSITALSGNALRSQNVRTVADLAQVVPGLTYTPSFTATPVYTLRGVGFYESSLAAYPDVSVYVDQVPLPFSSLATNAGLDLERVEVLKGPQGILFGQNATGGAINYIAAKPTNSFKTGLDVGFGRFNDAIVDGYVSGPLSDKLTARLSFSTENASPWQRAYYQPIGGSNGAIHLYAGRILLDWQATESLRFELNVNGGVDHSEPPAPQLIGTEPQFPGPNADAIRAYPLTPLDARAADFSPNNHPRSNNTQVQVSLRTDFSLSDDVTITSISSYVRYRRDLQAEFGAISIEEEELTRDVGKIDSVFQELRIANDPASRLRLVAGANYDHSNVDDFNAYRYTGGTSADGLGITGNGFFSNQRMNNYAAFGNVDWDVTRRITVKAGLRYTEADRSSLQCTQGGPILGASGVDKLIDSLMTALHGGQVFPPLQPADCVTLDPATLLSVRQGYKAKLNENNVSWRGGVDFKPSDDLLIYANVSKGYKAGSFPTVSASTFAQYYAVKQESVLDYEAGFKLALFNRRLRLTGAAFYYDYRDKQIRSQTLQPVFGPLNALVNVPKSKVEGAEVELSLSPIAGLTLSASGTYLNAKIIDYNGVNGAGIAKDFAGDNVPYTPKLSANASGDYSWNVGQFDASVGASLTYRSKSYAVIGPSPIDVINPYTLLDLRASMTTIDGKYKLMIYGKNVTDKYYWTNIYHPYDTITRYAGLPVTYGVMFSVRL